MHISSITSDITKHLSTLRMNSTSFRRQSSSDKSITISTQTLKESSDGLSNIQNQETLDTFVPLTLEAINSASSDPFDPSSYPAELIDPGLEMIRVTRRKHVHRLFKLNLPSLTLTWNSKASSKIEMDNIQSIRVGSDAKSYREEFNIPSDYNDLWITVIYRTKNLTAGSLSNDLKALHMIATSKRNLEIMINTLTVLSTWVKNQESLINCADVNGFSVGKWNNRIKKVNRQHMSFDDLIKLTSELNVNMNQSYLRQYFDECDKEKEGVLSFGEFQEFVTKLRNRKEVDEILAHCGAANGKLHLEQFKQFITKIQNEDFDERFIGYLFKKYSYKGEGEFMNQANLINYLNSVFNGPLISEYRTHSDYYSHPLTDYYISTSHNTYLLGKQVHGNSSIEGYIHALQRGCRCVEIDVWNNDDNHPIVTHGRTLTTSIDFELVIDTIRKYAFIATPFPLIISLEIRCSKEAQQRCVTVMKNTFGDMLLCEPLSEINILPSPQDLKHKILIKVKKSKQTTIVETSSSAIHSSFSTSSTQSEDLTASAHSDDSTTIVLKKIVPKPTRPTIIPELSILAPYFVGIRFRNFSLPESKTFNHVLSFSDRSLLSLLKDQFKLNAIVKHNKRGMMRIYPSVVRFKSDNFNPIRFWEVGCQMVATNWQIWDCGQEISESLFRPLSTSSGIGYSGYRLKPEILRRPTAANNKELIKIENLKALQFTILKKLDILILSGQQLPKPKELILSLNGYTPWVEIEVYNVKPVEGKILHHKSASRSFSLDDELSSDSPIAHAEEYDKDIGTIRTNHSDDFSSLSEYSLCFKTRLAENKDNAFNPIWNVLCRLSYFANAIDLSFIRIVVKTNRVNKTNVISKVGNAVVKNTSDYTVGSWCCKIGDMKEGYRQIRLVDNKGDELIHSSLLLKISKD